MRCERLLALFAGLVLAARLVLPPLTGSLTSLYAQAFLTGSYGSAISNTLIYAPLFWVLLLVRNRYALIALALIYALETMMYLIDILVPDSPHLGNSGFQFLLIHVDMGLCLITGLACLALVGVKSVNLLAKPTKKP